MKKVLQCVPAQPPSVQNPSLAMCRTDTSFSRAYLMKGPTEGRSKTPTIPEMYLYLCLFLVYVCTSAVVCVCVCVCGWHQLQDKVLYSPLVVYNSLPQCLYDPPSRGRYLVPRALADLWIFPPVPLWHTPSPCAGRSATEMVT